MEASSVGGILTALRRFGAEVSDVEVKKAGRRLPDSLIETLSAFANTPGGGVVILGVDEAAGFRPTGVADPAGMQANVASACADKLVPQLRPIVSLVEVEGVTLVVVEVEELPREQKPCYVRDRGLERGSYIRVGESDRRLTGEEVQQLIAERGQPRFDHEPVAGSDPSDLDPRMLNDYLARVRAGSPRIFMDEPDDVVLRMNNVTTVVDGRR